MGPGLAQERVIRWVFAGGKPQGIAILRQALSRRLPPHHVFCPPELPEADKAALAALAGPAGIPLQESGDLREAVSALAGTDLLVTCRFGLLDRSVFEAPRLGAVNVHSSLLPRYRGVHPVSWALVRGESVTGVTLHRIDAGVDTGPVVGQVEVPIGETDDIWSLTARLDAVSADLVGRVLETVRQTGLLPPSRPQSGPPSTAPRRRPEDGRIDWRLDDRRIHDLCRALRPPMPPSFAFTTEGDRVAILDSRRISRDLPADRPGWGGRPGEVLAAHADGWSEVRCGVGVLAVRPDRRLAPGMQLT